MSNNSDAIGKLKDSLRSDITNYSAKNAGTQVNAQILLNYLKSSNLFSALDDTYDGDKNKTSISASKCYAQGNNLLFQTDDGTYLSFNVGSGVVNQESTAEVANMLDTLDDGYQNSSIDADKLSAGQINLGADKISFGLCKTNDDGTTNGGVDSSDGKRLVNISSDNVESMLKGITGIDPKNALDFSQKVSSLVANKVQPDNSSRNQIASVLQKALGANGELDSLSKVTGLSLAKANADVANGYYSQILDKIYNQVINSLNTTTKAGVGDSSNTSFQTNLINSIKNVDISDIVTAMKHDKAITGDPHIANSSGQAYDFQGLKDGTHTLINGDDVSFNATFGQCYGGDDLGSTIIKSQELTYKGTGITIKSNANKTFEIDLNGQKIGDQTTFKNDDVQAKLKAAGINLNFDGTNLTTATKNRTITQQLAGGNINDIQATTTIGDSGLLSQAENIDKAKDNIYQYMVRDDGSAISAPVAVTQGQLKDTSALANSFVTTVSNNNWQMSGYLPRAFDGTFEGVTGITSSSDQKLTVKDSDPQTVKDAKNALKAILQYKEGTGSKDQATSAVSTWIKSSTEAIVQDINNNDYNDSIASKFKTNSGYSKSQWDEFMGTVADSTSEGADVDRNNSIDKGIDTNNDGYVDGLDSNNNGNIDDDEKFLINYGNYEAQVDKANKSKLLFDA